MMLGINALQPVERHVRIDLRGRNIGVSENRLHGTQVGAILDHVRGAGMTQHVWTSVPS